MRRIGKGAYSEKNLKKKRGRPSKDEVIRR